VLGAVAGRGADNSGSCTRCFCAPHHQSHTTRPPPPLHAKHSSVTRRPTRAALDDGVATQQQQQRTSLVPDTLTGMQGDTELQATLAALAAKGQAELTREEQRARQRSLDSLGVPPFARMCQDAGVAPLVRGAARILQLNIGLYCNQVGVCAGVGG